MLVKRTELKLQATAYSRDWDVERSIGCHLMQVVSAIRPAMDPTYKVSPYSEEDLENFSLPGFLWEHVMDRAEQLEHALSYEAIQQEKRMRRELIFPGEMFWCRKHDDIMLGYQIAYDHCKTHNCKGIFWTPDAHDSVRWRPVEWKVTWVSANRTSETSMEIWKYLTQTMWQAWGLESNGAEVNACFVNGDYSYPLTPKTYRFDIDYTPKELSNNHSMIVSNAIAKGWI